MLLGAHQDGVFLPALLGLVEETEVEDWRIGKQLLSALEARKLRKFMNIMIYY